VETMIVTMATAAMPASCRRIVMTDLALIGISLTRRNKACHISGFSLFSFANYFGYFDAYPDVAVAHTFLHRSCI